MCKTDWLCLDCELMPWSAKAQELLKQQYAAVGASARATLADEVAAIEQTAARGLDVSDLLAQTTARRTMVDDYVAAYRRYCWPVEDVNDLKLAPFHFLATEGKVHMDKRKVHYMKALLDEVFGEQNFRNEIILPGRASKNLQQQFDTISRLNVRHDTLLWYST